MFIAIDKVFTLENILYLAKGACLSIAIAALSLLIGLILGTLGASGRRSKHKIPRAISNIYVTVIRGTPLLLQILIIFSVIPSFYTAFTGNVLRIEPILIGIIAMSINSGAYQTELIRSGINGVDKGQWEACETLGLSSWQTMKLVILPQALRNILPPLGNEFITLIKDSSLLTAIGINELMGAAQIVISNSYIPLEPYFVAAGVYFVMTFVTSRLLNLWEKKLGKGYQR